MISEVTSSEMRCHYWRPIPALPYIERLMSLICDTTDRARASAIIYSLMLTCYACGVELLAWLGQSS